MRRVVVVYTGGTIGMRPDHARGGLVPALTGEQLVELDPALGAVAALEVLTWGMKPSSTLSFEDVLDIARVVGGAAQRSDIDGVVVVQGTDLIEETAYALDLVLDVSTPVVVVGAMKAAEEPGSDAAANLRDAVSVASTAAAAELGVLVVSAGEIHAADAVVKAHSNELPAFASPNSGPIGRVSGAGIALGERNRRAWIPAAAAAARVSLITAGLGVDERDVDGALATGARGLVVAGAGAGQTHPAVLDACRGAIGRGVPVVLATRCHAGSVAEAYAYPGSGGEWARSGAVLAGWLSALKCRIALALALGAGFDRARLDGLFACYRTPATERPGDISVTASA
jgi:L-asparaginase